MIKFEVFSFINLIHSITHCTLDFPIDETNFDFGIKPEQLLLIIIILPSTMKLLTFLISIAAFAAVYANPIQRVVGGVDARLHEIPYQISIQLRGQHRCGGSILNEFYVLTAAHCIVPEGSPDSVVVAGVHNLTHANGKEQTRVVEKWIGHKSYQGGVGPYDIALIKVSKPFVFNRAVQKISLPKEGEYPTGKATVSGWGSTSRVDLPSFPDVLQVRNFCVVH